MFEADQPYSPGDGAGYTAGFEYESTGPVGGTPDPELHTTVRANWSYRFDLSPGNYLVELLFVDFVSHGPGNFVFDVRIQGQNVITDLDIFPEAEETRYAIRYRLPAQITGTSMTVTSHPHIGYASVAAISVWDREPDAMPPGPPADLAGFGGFRQNLLKWADGAEDDLSGYRIHRSESPVGPFTPLGENLIHARRFFDASAEIGVTYHYYVTAVDAYDNESAPSDTVTAAALPATNSPLPVYEITIDPEDWTRSTTTSGATNMSPPR